MRSAITIRHVIPLLAAGLLVAGQSPQTGSIEGVVLSSSGDAMPRAAVRGTAEDGSGFVVYAGADGSYLLRGLRPGVFTVSTAARGFCEPAERRVRVEQGRVTQADFALEMMPITEVIRVTYPLPELMSRVDAVAHIRIARSHRARLWIPNITCGDGNVLTEHEADILTGIKVDDQLGPRARRLLFVQRRAGEYTEGDQSVEGPEVPHLLGDEFVGFFAWRGEDPYLGPHWDPWYLVPIRDGAVAWGGPAWIREIPEGMALDALLELLRDVQLRREPGSGTSASPSSPARRAATSTWCTCCLSRRKTITTRCLRCFSGSCRRCGSTTTCRTRTEPTPVSVAR